MQENNKLISGTYLVERKWDLIWLKNKLKNINETVKDDKFYLMLLQCFGYDYTQKILEVLSEEKKLVITGRDTGCTCDEFGDYVMQTITEMTE